MTAEAAQSALRLKARANPSAVGPSAMDTPKAIRVAMARAGDTALKVPVGVRNVEIGPVLPEGLRDAEYQDALLLSVRDTHGGLGLAAVCYRSLAAIIEASTLGAVFALEAEPRQPTHTDGVLVRGFLDDFLTGLGVLIEEVAHPPPIEGYKTGHAFEDLRAVRMGLEDSAHKTYRITVDFGLGAKIGTITLVLPIHRPTPQEEEDENNDWKDSLEKTVMVTNAELEGVLCNVSVTLAQVAKLAVGDVLPLPGASIDGVSVVAMDGRRVAGARLGKAGQMRALRLHFGEASDEADAIVSASAMPSGGDSPILSLPPADETTFSQPAADFDLPDSGGFGGAGDGLAMEAAPLDFDFNDGDGVLGAIEPIQVPASEANQG